MAEATRGNTSDSFEDFMAEFGPEFPPVYDPAVQTVIDQAVKHQHDIDNAPDAPPEVLNGIVQDLDSRWPLINQQIVVSGRVRAPEFEVDSSEEGITASTNEISLSQRADIDGRVITRDYEVSNRPLVSGGFIFVEKPQAVDSGYIGQRYLLSLVFQGSIIVAEKDGLPIETRTTISAKPDGVVFDTPYASTDFLRSRVETYYPDIAKQLGEIEALGEKASTAERLLKLRDILITYRTNTWMVGELPRLVQYVKRVINVEDDPTPMLIVAKPGARFFADPFDAHNNLVTNDRTTIGNFDDDGPELVTIPRINMIRRVPFVQPEPTIEPPIDAEHTLGVALSVRLIRPEQDRDIKGMVFLHDLIDIQDTRRMLIPKPNSEYMW